MEPYLSLASKYTGSGFDSPTQTALNTSLQKCETANVQAENNHTQLNRRDIKSLRKQTRKLIEDSEKPYKTHQECIEKQEELQERKEEQVRDAQEVGAKRRKLSENSDEFTSSQNSNLENTLNLNLTKDLSTASCEDSKDKIHSCNSHIQNCSENLSQKCNLQESEQSPMMTEDCLISEQFCQEQPQLNSVNSSYSRGSVASLMHDSNQHSKCLTTAHSLCSVFNGRLISEEIVSGRGGNDGLSFQCCNQHQFIISLSAILRLKSLKADDKLCYDSWCLKCRNFLRKTEQRAKKMNSTVISSHLNMGFVEIRCQNNHTFTVQYTKNHNKTWCEECKAEALREQETQNKDREMTEEQRKLREQRRLFEESYKYVQQKQQRVNQAFYSSEEAYYFDQVMKQVCTYAKAKMEREMSNDEFKGETTPVEIYNVYKIIYMPFQVLIKTLQMNRAQVASGVQKCMYKQMALLLHPDKNKHVMAKEAFQKLGQAYELCK